MITGTIWPAMTGLANATLQAAAAQNVNPCSVVIYWTPTNLAKHR
jgi:hypothetical protein